jgi:hypothetical protein
MWLLTLAFTVASLGPGGLPNDGRCFDSRVNVGYLFEQSNAKRVVEIDKVIPTDPRLMGYVIGYLAKTSDGTIFLTTRDADYLSPQMYGPLSELADRPIRPADAGRIVLPLARIPSASARFVPCVKWPKGLPYPAI